MSRRSSRFSSAGISSVLLLPLLLLLPIGLLHADKITLTNGKVVEGKVIEDGERIVIEVGNGSKIVLTKDQVAQIETAPTRVELLREKEAALEPGDGAALARLAQWCREQGLEKDRDRLYWRVLEILPNHATARETLGFRKLGALWLTEADYQHHHGNVEYQGKWIPVAEWERRTLADADLLEQTTCSGALETAADKKSPPEEAEEALAEFRAAPESLRRYTLARTLKSRDHRERQLAVRLTGELGGRRPMQSMTRVAVSDARRSVRDEALRVLQQWNDPDTALGFLPYLESDSDRERVSAARALNVFPDRRAVPVLITTAYKVWAGFGRAHFAQLVQRSYVQDYELVSGGTGLVVSEVADPIIDTVLEGIVLDIDVRRAEAISRIATLERVTGQSFGTDFEAWANWWKKEQGREPTRERAATADGANAAKADPKSR